MFFGSEGRAAVREGRKPETLHCFLEKYIHLENQCLDEFFDVSESCVYKCNVTVKATVIAVYMKESVKVTVIAVYMKASMTQRKNTVTGVNGLNRREIIRLRRRSGNT